MITGSAYSAAARAFALKGCFNECMRVWKVMLERQLTPRPDHGLDILMTIGYKKRHGVANFFFNQLKHVGCINTTIYNGMMTLCVRSPNPKKCHDVYREMVRKGHKPDITTYTTLVRAFRETNRPHDIPKVFNRVLDEDLEIDAIAFTVFTDCIIKLGLPVNTDNIFKMEPPEGTEPSIIESLRVQGMARDALIKYLLQKKERINCVPVSVWNTALRTCANDPTLGDLYNAIFTYLTRSDFKPDVYTATAVLRRFRQEKRYLEAANHGIRIAKAQPKLPVPFIYEVLSNLSGTRNMYIYHEFVLHVIARQDPMMMIPIQKHAKTCPILRQVLARLVKHLPVRQKLKPLDQILFKLLD